MENNDKKDLTGGKSFIKWVFSKDGGKAHFIVFNLFILFAIPRIIYSQYVEKSFDQEWMFPSLIGFLSFILIAYWYAMYKNYKELKKYS